MIDVFISYQNEDRHLAEKLSKALLNMGYSVWWDVNLLPGDDFQSEIRSVIENAKTVIVLWTSKSVESHFVRDEASLALKLKKLISTSYKIEIDEIPLGFKQIQTLDIKPAFDSSNFSLPDEVVQAIEKKVGRADAPKSEEELTNSPLEAGPTSQISAWKEIERKIFDESAYQKFLEDYGYNTPLSVVAQNRISDNQNKKRGSFQRFLFWVLILPGALITLYLNVPNAIEKLRGATPKESSQIESKKPEQILKEAIDKENLYPRKKAKILPNSLSPSKVIATKNAEIRYKGWRVPSDVWFGKINSVTVSSNNNARVFISSIPGNVAIFVYVNDLPPDIHENDYVEMEGEIGNISNHISLDVGTLTETDRGSIYRRFRKNYDDVICVQKKMASFGYYTDSIDGIDGYYTKRAVKNFLEKSPVLNELSLSKNATLGEVCNSLKSVSHDQYVKMVEGFHVKDLNDRIERLSTRSRTDLNSYSETLYESLVKADDKTWADAARRGKAKEIYDYLRGEHLKYKTGDRERLEKSEGRKKNRKIAMQLLGITFDPNLVTPPSIFMNTDKKMGTSYSFKLIVEADKNYLFHDGEELHGVSTCLNNGLLHQCYADGACTEKDIKNHGHGTIGGCVVLEVQKTFLGGVVSSKVREDLCERFATYVNTSIGHNTEAWVNSPYGYKQCSLHYSKEELNRLFSK